MTACDKKSGNGDGQGGPVDPAVVGEWKLESIDGDKAEGFGVYVKFGADGRFELYQQTDKSYYERLDGTFTAIDGTLSGRYSDGEALANTYDYRAEGNMLILKTRGENPEEDVYLRTEIPSDLLPAVMRGESASVPAGERKL